MFQNHDSLKISQSLISNSNPQLLVMKSIALLTCYWTATELTRSLLLSEALRRNLKKTRPTVSQMANYCTPPACPRTAVIHFLKKIHKTPMGIRPIVSTTNSATANLAEFLDIYLQAIMKKRIPPNSYMEYRTLQSITIYLAGNSRC